MPNNYLHNRKDFPDLLRILEQETGILAQLIEKDYWIMHVLHGLKSQGLHFELKGGTSLSKGYQIIHRFSEDIDIHIHPPQDLSVKQNPAKTKTRHIQSRKDFYDWLAQHISIDGIVSIERDTAFDDERYYRSGGIRLHYESKMDQVAGVKEGILLEVGFDNVAPNNLLNISSWAFDRAMHNASINIFDNRAVEIACYAPGYTFVEKLQTIATKYRQEQESGQERPNLMRQYYAYIVYWSNLRYRNLSAQMHTTDINQSDSHKLTLKSQSMKTKLFYSGRPSKESDSGNGIAKQPHYIIKANQVLTH